MLDGGIVFILVLVAGVIAYIKGAVERKKDEDKYEPTKADIEAFKSWYRSHKRSESD
jgi:hypothetical protein